ncbi:hypothetical protein PG990_006421 [Apiospora arundinis]|uniref:Developmental regulatory protein wetA n=1 Tax=Apiospora arundinis TaxID=335852 RepID=A0ABR2JB98_9PEZI
MAFTAAQLPVDKDQASFWQSNEGELGVANDHFFDQFVTFEAGEPTTTTTSFDCQFLEDPPSPSLLLDSLDDCLTNSSNDQGSSSGGTSLEESTANKSAAATRYISSTQSNNHSVSGVTATIGSAEPVTGGGGSISDSELLRLEGISLRSSPNRALATAPSSPSLLPVSSLSPRKRDRFVDSVYATCRRVAHRPKPQRMHIENDMFEINGDEVDILRELQNPRNPAVHHLESTFEPIDNNGLPLSPPLTGKIPPPSYQSRSRSGFVSGPLEDPFTDGLMISPTAVLQADGQHTPLPTPSLNDDFFCLDTSHNVDNLQASSRLPKQRSTSSAEWPMEASISDNSQLWSAGSYIPDSGNLQGAEWWESTPTHGNGVSSQQQTPSSQNKARNASLNLAMHNQQAELPYEFSSDLSGLMIHMPQPRQPQAAVLTAHIPDQLSTPQHHRHHHQLYHRNTDHGHHHRRPVPRAPSSGARHRQHLPAHGGYMTSPRKPSTLHQSPSRPMLSHRDESTSPTPTGNRHRSSSMSVRKQRSWSRREPRTPNPHQHHSFSASSGGCSTPTTTTTSATTPTMISFGGGGGGGVDFVNFTPSDKNVLMTGVAPSGSSKTKARREKEAVERRRKLSEAAVKAVQAAGGDLDRLLAEGFTL